MMVPLSTTSHRRMTICPGSARDPRTALTATGAATVTDAMRTKTTSDAHGAAEDLTDHRSHATSDPLAPIRRAGGQATPP